MIAKKKQKTKKPKKTSGCKKKEKGARAPRAFPPESASASHTLLTCNNQFQWKKSISSLPRLTIMLSLCLNIPLISGWLWSKALDFNKKHVSWSTFPAAMKCIYIALVHKKEDRTGRENYQPIRILLKYSKRLFAIKFILILTNSSLNFNLRFAKTPMHSML